MTTPNIGDIRITPGVAVKAKFVNNVLTLSGLESWEIVDYSTVPWKRGWRPATVSMGTRDGFNFTCCGIQGCLTGINWGSASLARWFHLPEVIQVLRKLLDTGAGSTYVLCITDLQLQLLIQSGVLDILKKEFIVHECGWFPNYNHGTNNMNFLAINFSATRKKTYPVSWARNAKEEMKRIKKEKENEILDIPQDVAVRGAVRKHEPFRDANGRFARRPF